MNTGIHIDGSGGGASERDSLTIAAAIATIFQAGHDTHMDQATLQAAIAAFRDATSTSITGLTISGSSVHGDTVARCDHDRDEEVA